MSLIADPTYADSGGEPSVLVVVRSGGNRPLCAESVPDALELLDRERVDLVLTDLNMPGLGGLDLLAELSARRSAPPVLVVSGCEDTATIRAASLLGAVRVVE